MVDSIFTTDDQLTTARRLHAMGKLADAQTLCEHILEQAPNHAGVMCLLGTILAQLGQTRRATELLLKSIELDPALIPAWNSLGVLYQSQGAFPKAAACFEKMLSIDPNNAIARSHLVNTGREAAVTQIEPLEAMLRHYSLPTDQRIAAEFALGSALDQVESYDEAFGHFARANELAKQVRSAMGAPYDREATHRRVDQIMQLFTAQSLASRRNWGDASERPVFVVGMPRSGTTLVQQIAASHPMVCGAGELNEIPQLAATLVGGIGSGSARELASKYLRKLDSIDAKADRVIDKLPGNLFYLGLIAILFPRARVVLCRRDPRDTCLSCYFQSFGEGNAFSFDLTDCGHFYRENNRLIQHWRQALPLPALEVQYEEIVDDLEGQSRRLIDFLGLPWHPACLEFYRATSAARTSSVWQVRQPIYRRSVGRWRHYEKHLQPLLAELP